MTLTHPKVSIVTVVFNSAATLRQTIKSVFNQTYPNFEYIIIDGKSTDATVEIIKEHQRSLAYWVSEKDTGIYDAMNKGIAASKGDWIIFMGADDIFYMDEVLAKIFLESQLESVDFIYGDVILKSGKKIGKHRDYYELIETNINHQAIFYKRSVFNKVGFYNLRYKILADFDLNLRIFKDTSLVKKYMPLVITLYNNKGLSNFTLDAAFFDDQLKNLIGQEKVPTRSPVLQQYYFYSGYARLVKGKWASGFKNIIYAITSGKRKIFFFLLAGKFFLSAIGIGKKINIVGYE